MTLIRATSEDSAQALTAWRVYNGQWWWEIRAVGWISQNSTTLQTTLYYKWQTDSFNYWPYWKDAHTYTVSGNGQSKSNSFSLPQYKSNGARDMTSAQSLTFGHNASTGECSVNLRFQGAKCWETFDYTEGFSFPTITPPEPTPGPEPEPEPEEESVPIINDTDPKYYIYADGEVLYSLTNEEYYIANPKLTLELNQIDSLDFNMPPSHALYSSLSKLKTTIEVKQGSEVLFRGRVLDDDIDFYNRKTVHCEGALAFLNDTIKAPYSAGTYKTVDALFKAALDEHTSQVPNSTPKRKLKFVKCNVTTAIESENDEYSQTMDVIRSLVDENGGYLKLEYYDTGETGLSYFSAPVHTSSQIIDFGENLLDLNQKTDAAEIYTSVVCLGKKNDETGQRLKTGSGSAMFVESADAINTFGRIIRVFTYDDIESQSELRSLAQVLLALGVQQSITFTIKAVDLHFLFPNVEKIRIGDSVQIRSAPHNINSFFQCSRIDMDLQSPDNTEYTFGATIKALTDTTSKK